MPLFNALTSRLIRDISWGRIKTDYFVYPWYGMKLIFPIGFLNMLIKGWEPESRCFLERNVRESEIVLDIGACNGLYTALFSKLVGNNGKVFSFEPDPSMFKLLEANIQINGLKNVIASRTAISDTNRVDKLYTSSAGASSLKPVMGSRSIIDVDVVTIDSLNFDRIDWIKIDTEGTEYLVLNGAKRTLYKNRPRLLIEFLPQFGKIDNLLQALNGWKITGLDYNILCTKGND